jgi:HPt (histidine-containing phosphotransfer) domain-containing protein
MPAIDPKVMADLRALQSGGAPGFLAELIDIYLREADQHVTKIRISFDDRDAHALERSAHTLKGGSGNLGAKALSALCSELQGVAKAANWIRAADLVPQIEREHAAASAELKVERAR